MTWQDNSHLGNTKYILGRFWVFLEKYQEWETEMKVLKNYDAFRGKCNGKYDYFPLLYFGEMNWKREYFDKSWEIEYNYLKISKMKLRTLKNQMKKSVGMLGLDSLPSLYNKYLENPSLSI